MLAPEKFPYFTLFCVFIGLMFSYPCVKMGEFHHPGFLFSMVFKSTRLVTSILVVGYNKKVTFVLPLPYATILNLRSQINSKSNLTSDLFWQSNCGKPLHDFVPLKAITGAVIINRHLTGGVECCLKGCKNETHKFDSMIGQYEIKCSSHVLTGDIENVKNLN
jgi:hypothetical protein